MKMKMKKEMKIKKAAIKLENKLKKDFAEYLQKYTQRNIKYKFKALVNKGKKEIEKFRDKWGIPVNGFDSPKACRKWWRTLPPEVKAYRRPIYYYEIERLIMVHKFEETSIYSSFDQEGTKRLHFAGRSLKKVFEYEVEELMTKIKIDPFWYLPFENYVLYDEVNMNLLPNPGFIVSVRTSIGNGGKPLAEYISVILSANTRLKDVIKFSHPILTAIQKQLMGYYDEPEKITKYEEKEYKLAPKYNRHRTTKTWLVSVGYLR